MKAYSKKETTKYLAITFKDNVIIIIITLNYRKHLRSIQNNFMGNT